MRPARGCMRSWRARRDLTDGTRMNRITGGACALMAALTPPLAPTLRGQTGASMMDQAVAARPKFAGRIVQHFDFEESRINPFPVPRYWRRAQGDRAGVDGSERPGFPLWNEAALDYRTAAAGEGSVFLPASGGSTRLRLEPGVLPVFPGADYLVSAAVRTRGIQHARARMTARFLDTANQPIAGSETSSELIGDAASWRPVSLRLTGETPTAAFLQIDLELLQPVQFAAPTLGKHHVSPEDFAAAAWFDDVMVVQLPRIELSTNSPVNVVVAPSRPQVRILVRDLTGESMRARTTFYDLDGKPVDSDERSIGVGQADWTWSPRAEAYGWYRVRLEVLSGQSAIVDDSLGLVWLPEPARRSARDHFGIVLESADSPVAETVALIRGTGAAAITVPIWTDDLAAETAAQAAESLGGIIDAALVDDTRVIFALTRVPRPLGAATGVGHDDPLAVFGRAEETWGPYVRPFAERYGQSVRWWQVGFGKGSRTWSSPEGLRHLRTLRRFLGDLVPGPAVALRWPAEVEGDWNAIWRAGAPDGVDAVIPAATDPQGIVELIGQWHDPAPVAELAVVLDGTSGEAANARTSIVALSRKALSAWAASDRAGARHPVVASIRQPWTWTDGSPPRVSPEPELALWRSLGDRLGGLRFIGELPIAPRTHGMLFGEGTSGLLVAWREAPGESMIDAFLGDGDLVAFDLFGNGTRVESRITRGTGGPVTWRTHQIPVSETPIFVEGVDTGLARFISSLAVEPAFASSARTQHEIELVLTNPWSQPISGSLTIVEPGGLSGQGGQGGRDRTWRVSPRQVSFDIPAGGDAHLPITLSFGAMEEAGVKAFVVDVDLEGRPELGRLRMQTQFEIGLPELRLDLTSRIAAGGSDVMVEAVVQNNGPAPVTLELTAFAPPGAGFARSRATVSRLAPGDSAVRRFPFPRGAARLVGETILVGVQDTASGARLNRSVRVVEAPSITGVPDDQDDK